VKKLFALLAVVALAAIGCDDKSKTTGKPSGATGGGTFEKKDTVQREVNATVTNTVLQHTAVETKTNTVAVTKTVDVTKTPGGPAIPDPKKPGDR
jgi:hypothetical protein